MFSRRLDLKINLTILVYLIQIRNVKMKLRNFGPTIFCLASLAGALLLLQAPGLTLIGECRAAEWVDDDRDESTSDNKWTIDQDALARVANDIKILASAEMGGRQPGTPGIKLAEDYLVAQYEAIGLQPLKNGTYLQEFEVGRTATVDSEKSTLVFNGPDDQKIELAIDKDWQLMTSRGDFQLSSEVVFVGYGISAEEMNFDEYAGIDVDGKVVVLVRMEPLTDDPDSIFKRESPSRHASGRAKGMAARRANAAAVFMLNDYQSAPNDEQDELVASDRFGRMNLPFAQIKRSAVEQILKSTPLRTPTGEELGDLASAEKYISEKLEPLSQTLEGWTVDIQGSFKTSGVKTNNVVGVIEGEGPNAHETVVIGGHYDHLGDGAYGSRAPGRREIHHGADDNASGTAAVLELARRFSTGDKKPPRRMVFICFSAEEMGLLGAVHYVNNPEFPLEDTVMMFNFDMIGWLRNDQLSMISWNSSPQFLPAMDDVNEEFGFGLNVLKPRSSVGGSDHMPFNARNIPNIFFHTGLHEVYHTPEDNFDAINSEGALRVIDYSEKFIERMIQLPKRPSFGPPAPFRLGVTLVSDSEQAEIEEIAEGSPAAKAGLLVGDLIVAINDTEVNSRRTMTRLIRQEEGKTAKFKLRRGDAEIVLNIELVNPKETEN